MRAIHVFVLNAYHSRLCTHLIAFSLQSMPMCAISQMCGRSFSGIVYDTFQGELTVRTEKEVDEEIYGMHTILFLPFTL